MIAAKQCFESVSSNRIDFEQFRDWYVTPSTTTNVSAKQGEQNSLPLFVSASRELITRFEERRDSGKLSRVAPFVALRRAAGLYNSTPKEMLEQFASVSNEEGLVTQESYLRVFQNLSRGSDIETSLSTARALFGSLVTSQDEDTVDFVELMTCVCLLAPGTLRERLHYVFSVYVLVVKILTHSLTHLPKSLQYHSYYNNTTLEYNTHTRSNNNTQTQVRP